MKKLWLVVVACLVGLGYFYRVKMAEFRQKIAGCQTQYREGNVRANYARSGFGVDRSGIFRWAPRNFSGLEGYAAWIPRSDTDSPFMIEQGPWYQRAEKGGFGYGDGAFVFCGWDAYFIHSTDPKVITKWTPTRFCEKNHIHSVIIKKGGKLVWIEPWA